jgi:predicted nucleic acid-binding protein
VVVSDAGPLISLGRLDLLDLLGALFSEVRVPDAVIGECLARPGNIDAQRIQLALDKGLLVTCSTAPQATLHGLELGESAAILCALEIGASVLMDERAGRERALAMGLAVIGTLGVLVRARQRGLVGPLAPLVAALRASGQRLGQAAAQLALSSVGEAES